MLLQIDSERSLDMSWGDGGRLYVLIATASFEAGALGDAYVECQCT